MAGWEKEGGYLKSKYRKLSEQNSAVNKISEIFCGVHAFIDGYTDPPADKLKLLILSHGGQYYHIHNKHVTHIIARNLPQSKMKLLQSHKVVSPDWILDSISKSTLLDWKVYRIEQCTQENKGNYKDLIDTFFGRSRLHHLSTWAKELRASVVDFPVAQGWSSSLGVEILQKLSAFNSKWLTVRSNIRTEESMKIYAHIDMDSFFVSVALQSNPALRAKEVAVCHAQAGGKASSMSEIASCSYEARVRGVRNGMLLKRAKTLCPNLILLPYEFSSYKRISDKLYASIAELTNSIEVVSCDEMFFDLTELLHDTPQCLDKPPSRDGLEIVVLDPVVFAKCLRSALESRLEGCSCSCGLGTNKLLARMATKRAKPAGQSFLFGRIPGTSSLRWNLFGESPEEDTNLVGSDLCWLDIQALANLPGIGAATVKRLQQSNTTCVTCGDCRQNMSLKSLTALLGQKLGQKLHDACRGLQMDDLQLEKPPKSVSVEMNYAIRLADWEAVRDFVNRLSTELSNRASETLLARGTKGVQGRSLSVKIMIRAAGESVEPSKYLGHGICDRHSHTIKLIQPTSDGSVIAKHAFRAIRSLCSTFRTPPSDLRGIALQLAHLQCTQYKPDPPSSSSIWTSNSNEALDGDVSSAHEATTLTEGEVNTQTTSEPNEAAVVRAGEEAVPLSALDWNALQQWIHDWVERSVAPTSAEASPLVQHLLDIVPDNLALVRQIMKCWHRAVEMKAHRPLAWHSILAESLDLLNTQIPRFYYGARLDSCDLYD